jgi:hypothetical protein
MSVACRPHLQAQLGREARADWVEVLVRETMARKVTAVAITDHHDGCGDLVQAAAKRLDTGIRVYAALRSPARTTLSASPSSIDTLSNCILQCVKASRIAKSRVPTARRRAADLYTLHSSPVCKLGLARMPAHFFHAATGQPKRKTGSIRARIEQPSATRPPNYVSPSKNNKRRLLCRRFSTRWP